MASNPTRQAIQHLSRVLRQNEDGRTDAELLGCFVERRDEAAFAALVRRHGPMIWGVCRRQLSHHEAEDAFQATFLVLARKAGSIRCRERVASWLYGVARQTALQARRTAARSRARERQVEPFPEPQAAEPGPGNELRPLLDQELSRLPDAYRVVVLLCDLEGKTRKEAARQLGLPEGTVGSRLARARALLAQRLARRGLAVSGGALAAALAREAASASVPILVVSSLTRAAGLLAAGRAATAGLVSARGAALAKGVIKAMFLSKIKAAAAALAVGAVLGGLLLFGPGWHGGGHAGAQEERRPAPEQPAALPPFTLEVGKYYQVLLSDHRQWPGELGLVQVRKNYANGWVEIRTEENQTAWLNLNQAIQIYLIPDPAKYHREAARGAR